MKKCINCGRDNADEMDRCERCGRLIDTKSDLPEKKYNYRCKNCDELISVRYTAKDLCPYCHQLPGNPKPGGMTASVVMHLKLKGL